jgi:hypothetical protein
VPVPLGQPVAGPATSAVGAEVAAVEPVLSVAVTFTRSVAPTSALVTTYVLATAPPMAAHPAPAAVQRCPSYANAICVPVYVPGSAVSVSPSRAVPVIVGGAVLGGAAGAALPLLTSAAIDAAAGPSARPASEPASVAQARSTGSRGDASHRRAASHQDEPAVRRFVLDAPAFPAAQALSRVYLRRVEAWPHITDPHLMLARHAVGQRSRRLGEFVNTEAKRTSNADLVATTCKRRGAREAQRESWPTPGLGSRDPASSAASIDRCTGSSSRRPITDSARQT